jgi:hypothetical protein
MAGRPMMQPREGYAQPTHPARWPSPLETAENQIMSAEARVQVEIMIRLGRGLLNTLEKWLQEQR